MTTTPGPGAAPLGLRERKKQRTRAEIRRQAFRLFLEQGYNATTVEQIAEAAEVSPSTFFRYFPSKEAVVMTDDFDEVVVSAMQRVEPGSSAVATIRKGIREALRGLGPSELAFEQQRQALIQSVPELRSIALDEFVRNVRLVCAVMGERLGVDPNSLELKVFAGAVIGGMLAAVMDSPTDLATGLQQADQALAMLEHGLPF